MKPIKMKYIYLIIICLLSNIEVSAQEEKKDFYSLGFSVDYARARSRLFYPFNTFKGQAYYIYEYDVTQGAADVLSVNLDQYFEFKKWYVKLVTGLGVGFIEDEIVAMDYESDFYDFSYWYKLFYASSQLSINRKFRINESNHISVGLGGHFSYIFANSKVNNRFGKEVHFKTDSLNQEYAVVRFDDFKTKGQFVVSPFLDLGFHIPIQQYSMIIGMQYIIQFFKYSADVRLKDNFNNGSTLTYRYNARGSNFKVSLGFRF